VQVQPDLTHLALRWTALKICKHLAGLGLNYSDGPTTSFSGIDFAFIDAPEGYRNRADPERRRRFIKLDFAERTGPVYSNLL